MFTAPTTSRWPVNSHRGQRHRRPSGLCRRRQDGHRLEVPRSSPVKHAMPANGPLCPKYERSLPTSQRLIRRLWCRSPSLSRTPRGSPTKIVLTPCSRQKSITLRVPLCRRSRTRRSVKVERLHRARPSFRCRREPFLQRALLRANRASCLESNRFWLRIARPEITNASPVSVTTAAWWTSPRSTHARAVPGTTGGSVCVIGRMRWSWKPSFQTSFTP